MTSSEQMRRWTGPALFTYGFRPFFLFGALWAALAMCLWIPMLSGLLELPTRLDAVSWHAHEFLFGYLGAIIAGFLLTAVPNWTGRLPVVGWQLAALFGLWVAGRVAVSASALMPAGLPAAIDLAFPLVLGAVILREIIAGKNWRNLIVLGLLAVFTLANLVFHIEAAQGAYAAQGAGLRLGLATAVMMIAVIGGRIVPSFTRNWLVKQGIEARPAAPMQRLDKLVLVASVAALLTWVLVPERMEAGLALILTGALHAVRLARWQGHRTLREPLLWVLHATYALIPLGAVMLGLGIVANVAWTAAAQHIWMAGAIGGMTLAVMTRATLGHTGQQLVAGKGTVMIYLALLSSVAARLAVGALPDVRGLTTLSGALWLAAFGGFAVVYGPCLLSYRKES
ncbi:NnrS family protein [Roseovarius sp. S4756]|uniref:NnrS family protein n=1 Tax=Roseovarius maritimus TaxID=3342637 RepID=UPI00372A2685